MSGPERGALETLRVRIDHVSATARLLASVGGLDIDMSEALAGIAATLNEVASQLDDELNPKGEA
ncbi:MULTISPECIES: hypothetical protein [unclassified Sphingomonas]|uniref:hypothetical protein n=1 Tax=unclassified Sphingomonas TaxID=196159 RepID=UPI00226A2075|nr:MULTISPECIES: hypothetical protein [unclassified Sphingomonas]